MCRHQSRISLASAAIIAIACAQFLRADPYDLSWRTVDGGGGMFSTGGDFELSGTIGQHDAGSHAAPMMGDDFAVVGGFWVASAMAECTCPGDMNGDFLVDGDDIQIFVNCLIGGGPGCACGDIDGVGGVTANDVTLLVNGLLSTSGCL